jgi:hypothetical protein
VQSFSSGSGNQLDAYVERLRMQLPAAPEPLLDAYVRFAPWVAIIFGAIGLFFLVIVGLLGSVLVPLAVVAGASSLGSGAGFFINLLLGIVGGVVEIAGGYLMLQRRLIGWWLLALGLVVSALNDLFSFSLIALIIVALIAYVHLMVKPRYS